MRIPVALAMLLTFPIAHRVCTAEALYIHANFMEVIHDCQSETVLVVEGNHPTMFADLAFSALLDNLDNVSTGCATS